MSNILQSFATIDDAVHLADQLVDNLHKLAQRRYPLAVRKGVKTMMGYKDSESSQTMKGSGRTYFFDVKRTKDGKAFLTITESRKDKDGKFVRMSIAIFPEDKEEFANLLTAKLSEI